MITATHPYAEVLGDRDPLQVLAETEKGVPNLAQRLGAKGLGRSYAPGKWTAAQILSHLADCELAFGFRVRQLVAQPELGIQAFDENRWARYYDRFDGIGAAQAFQGLRAWNLSLFRLLTREDLDKAAAHPSRGKESAETVIRIMAGHTLHHLAQLEKIAAG